MSKQDRWKDLERDAADHFDLLIKKKAEENDLPYKRLLSEDGKIIERNKRGADFGHGDSDIDVIVPGIDFRIGGPFLIEAKYRKGNILPKLFNDFSKSRPSSFLTPLMILSCRGKHYMMRWLADFQHKNWMRDREWSDVWITSKKLNKSNTYVEDWMVQAEDYFQVKAEQFSIDVETLTPLVVTRGFRSKAIIIQRIELGNEFMSGTPVVTT